MKDTKHKRIRRGLKTRHTIRASQKHRLSVHRTPRHMYAQIISPDGSTVVVHVSTAQSTVKSAVKYTGNVAAAEEIGTMIGKLAIEKGIKEVAFDRAGFMYHGRVKALAESARKAGLKF